MRDSPHQLILGVDDNAHSIQVLFKCLKKAQYKVLVTQTGESVIIQAQKPYPI